MSAVPTDPTITAAEKLTVGFFLTCIFPILNTSLNTMPVKDSKSNIPIKGTDHIPGVPNVRREIQTGYFVNGSQFSE